ncbi:hypothetical protein HYDPIDRAFT_101623, partial [Hydnomerulius pinastri MD-312]
MTLPTTYHDISAQSYTAYKRVDKKIRPVSGAIPLEFKVTRQFPHNPLDSLIPLTPNPPAFVPTKKLTQERMDSLEINKKKFLWPDEVLLFQHILALNEDALAFEDAD